jgi:hypothetical protein
MNARGSRKPDRRRHEPRDPRGQHAAEHAAHDNEPVNADAQRLPAPAAARGRAALDGANSVVGCDSGAALGYNGD